MTSGYDLIAETLAARGDDVERVEAALRAQELELPSWAFGNSGTRFAVFSQPGVPRDPFEKLADAAEVHRLTGVAPSVALHIPWDRVDNVDALNAHAAELGLRIGAINPNLFQEPDYKLGSLSNPDAGTRRKAVAHVRECIDIATQVGIDRDLAVARGRHELSRPGLAAGAACTAARLAPRDLRRARSRPAAARRVQALRARLLRDRPGRLGLRPPRLPGARRARQRPRRPRSPCPGREHRADRLAPRRRGPAGRLPLQRPQVR